MSAAPDSRSTPVARLAAIALAVTLFGAPLDHARAQTPTVSPAVAEASPGPGTATSTPASSTPPSITPTRDMPAIRPPAAEFADNPYGLRALWAQGDSVARLTLLILLIMSVGSWYVLVKKLIEQRQLRLQARAAKQAFSSAGTLRQGADTLSRESPFSFIVESSLDSVRKHEAVAGQVDLNTWVTQNIERSVAAVQSRTQDGLAVLATVGATAPFVGLFGTVWGIYNALVKIGASGQASIDKVAGPVGEALIMTAIGLAVAVPAVLSYNWLVRRNRLAMEEVRGFGSDLHTQVLSEVGQSRRAQAPGHPGA